jgi:hypothetical protein
VARGVACLRDKTRHDDIIAFGFRVEALEAHLEDEIVRSTHEHTLEIVDSAEPETAHARW